MSTWYQTMSPSGETTTAAVMAPMMGVNMNWSRPPPVTVRAGSSAGSAPVV